MFAHTYDTSFDGQNYHQSAVIELSSKWNPIYEKTPPVGLPRKVTLTIDNGYPKTTWSIEASIYKLTHNIDSATVINMVIGLLALAFLYYALKSLDMKSGWAVVTALLSVITAVYLQQFFTFMEDALSYEWLLIGVSSLILIVKNKRSKLPYLLCLLASFIFMAGTKYSNLFIFLGLLAGVLYITLQYDLFKLKSFKFTLILGIIIAILTLTNPYITNTYRFNAIDYPMNQKGLASSLRFSGVPLNIKNDDSLKLFYYGIFSAAETGNAQLPANDAHLKIPFTFTNQELNNEASAIPELVGGYGVLFSGIFSLSVASYLYLLIRKKSKYEMTAFAWLSFVLGLIIATCLLSPIPSYARQNSQLALLPIAIIVALLLTGKGKWRAEKIIAIAMTVLMLANIFLAAVPVCTLRHKEFNSINTQLVSLRDTHKTYAVHTSIFYSSYLKLRSHGVRIVISKRPIKCPNEVTLDYTSNSTKLCEL
jgi:hypothetical protein